MCLIMKFTEHSTLRFSVKKGWLEQSVTRNCKQDSNMNFVERVFMQLMWISRTLLVIYATVEMSRSFATALCSNSIAHGSWQRITGTKPSCTVSSSSFPSLANYCPQMMCSVVSSDLSKFSSFSFTFFSCPLSWLANTFCVLFNWQVCLFFPHFWNNSE